MLKTMFVFVFLIVNMNLLAQSVSLNNEKPVGNDTSATVTRSKKAASNNRFSIACGVGISHGLAGLSLSYDFAHHWGADLITGAARFPGALSLRYNIFIDQYPIVISPRAFFGTTFGNSFSKKAEKFEFDPAIGFGTEIRTYMNRFLYLNNILGMEYELDGQFILNSGICLGYTFGGENPGHHWVKDQLVPSGGLTCLNLAVGFLGTFVVPFMIFRHNFSFSMNMPD